MDAVGCRSCGTSWAGDDQPRCRYCGSADLAPVDLSDTGEVVSVTSVRLAPPGTRVPYRLAYADFQPHARLLARAPDGVSIGDVVAIEPVEVEGELFRFVARDMDEGR